MGAAESKIAATLRDLVGGIALPYFNSQRDQKNVPSIVGGMSRDTKRSSTLSVRL